MQRRDARGFGHWIRLNVLDVWQVVGTLGLIVGTLTFAILIANGRPVLPANGAIQLLQTLVSNSPHAQPTVEPTPSTTPGPGATAPAPRPSAPRVPAGAGGPAASQPAAPRQSPAPTPVSIPTPTPTPRPCLYALCPSPSPLP